MYVAPAHLGLCPTGKPGKVFYECKPLSQQTGTNSDPVRLPVFPEMSVAKKERKQTTQGRDGRTVHRHHTGIFKERRVWC